MSEKPWDFWTPGVLSKVQTRLLCEKSYIVNVKDIDESVGYSSIDLHLSDEGFIMTQGSVKPSGPDYLKEILDFGMVGKL